MRIGSLFVPLEVGGQEAKNTQCLVMDSNTSTLSSSNGNSGLVAMLAATKILAEEGVLFSGRLHLGALISS